jgi:hypothetical protein
MIKVETLKELYRANRVLRSQNERYLKIIDRLHTEKLDRDEKLTQDDFSSLFNFIF